MTRGEIDTLLALLESSEAEPILRAVAGLRLALADLQEASLRSVLEAICGLFYIDLYDRPDLQQAVDEAEETIASAGERAVPILIHLMEGSDAKSHLHLARVLGRIGLAALPRLREMIATSEEPYGRAFALYAVGKIESDEVHVALPETVGALMHPDKEVRDSAARTLGKIVERVPAGRLTERRRAEIYESLMRTTADLQAAVRAKAIRSLGKMARHAYLAPEQMRRLRERLRAMLTRDETSDWDRAYIVRREAQEALRHLEVNSPPGGGL